jgi:hypothetical protein
MTPLERHNVMAKSLGAPIVERPTNRSLFPVEGPTSETVAELARRETKVVPAIPAKPATAPAATPADQAARIEALDADLRAQGLQKPRAPDGRFIAKPTVADVDQAALEALNKTWRALTPEQREANRSTWQNDLRTIFEGRKLGESLAQFQARNAGTVSAVVSTAPPNPPREFTPQQWQEGHRSVTTADGFIPMERINAAGLSGYVLPKLIEGQQYHSSVFRQLADARAAGLTQAQVDAYIKQQMETDGYIK